MSCTCACSSNDVDVANTPPGTVDVASYEYKAQVVQDNVSVIPDWFTEMPESDKANLCSQHYSITRLAVVFRHGSTECKDYSC